MNPYAIAFAVGYYYGRSFARPEDIIMPEQDTCYRSNIGFTAGFEAGRRDFQEIDLPLQAAESVSLSPEAELVVSQ